MLSAQHAQGVALYPELPEFLDRRNYTTCTFCGVSSYQPCDVMMKDVCNNWRRAKGEKVPTASAKEIDARKLEKADLDLIGDEDEDLLG